MDDDLERRLRQLLDRDAVKETLYRYASRVDVKDFAGVRDLLTADASARYGDHEPVTGRDEVVAFIERATADRAWQHHKLTVYHVDIEGDVARALTYHTSHQTRIDDPDTVIVIIARYHDTLHRTDGAWRISDKVMEIGWRETRGRTGATA